jgi:hypothetical protein
MILTGELSEFLKMSDTTNKARHLEQISFLLRKKNWQNLPVKVKSIENKTVGQKRTGRKCKLVFREASA